jgi:hypothetical protein
VTAPTPAEPERRPPPAGEPARLLPDRSADETEEGWGERPHDTDDDRFLGELPPHHIG